MQLAPNQPTYDIMIPIYFGNPDEPFDESCCGVIQVQVKDKDRATKPESIFREPFTEVFTEAKKPKVNQPKVNQPKPKKDKSQPPIRKGKYFVLNEMTHPVLCLLFDLGVISVPGATSELFQVSHTSGEIPEIPDVWAIHSRGYDYTVFGCLVKMNCQTYSQMFFTSINAENTTHNELCQRNKVFSKLERNFKYTGSGTVHEHGAGVPETDTVKSLGSVDGQVGIRRTSGSSVSTNASMEQPDTPTSMRSRASMRLPTHPPKSGTTRGLKALKTMEEGGSESDKKSGAASGTSNKALKRGSESDKKSGATSGTSCKWN
jgi:hypothetical protein